jgi:sulfite exporter TauE/SafE
MDIALAGSALLMGLAGAPHCLAMCGPACAGLTHGERRSQLSLHFGRLLSYAVGGAVAAASVGLIADFGKAVAVLRPLWVLVHMAALMLGIYLLWRGRQPAWIESIGRRPTAGVATVSVAGLGGGAVALGRPVRAGAAGLAWLAWPCGLLQSALMVAALASGPLQGALVMVCFAAASGLGLLLGPMLLNRLFGFGEDGMRWAVRAAGLGLVLASGWALSHGLWERVVELCS